MIPQMPWSKRPLAVPTTPTGDPNPEEHKNGHYSIVASEILRPNTEYRIAVTTFEVTKPISFRLSIVGGENTIKSEEVTLSKNESRMVIFEIGNIPKLDSYMLVAEGLSGIVFKEKSRLKFDDKCCSVLIQTDKSVYKPGDTVRYRVLVLDRGFRPLSLSNGEMTVFICDGQGNRVKQWTKVALGEYGVFEAELPLSTEPVLGEWTINVEGTGQKQTKTFDVDQYVLPTYEVTVDSPGFTVIDDELLKVVVTAKYTYGKPVVGELTLSVKPSGQACFWRHTDEVPICKQVVAIDGKTVVEFNLKDIMKKDVYFRDICVEAEVKETLTGRTQNGSITVHIHEQRYDVSLVEDSRYFPGLPYTAWVKVSNIDGSPVQDTSHTVQISLRNPNIDLFKETLTLDNNGMAKLNVNLDNLEFSYLQVEVMYLGKSYFVQGISKPDETDKAFMRVRPKEKTSALGSDLQFDVTCTEGLKHLAYTLLARGELVAGGGIDALDSKTVVINLPSTNRMLPRAKLLVHYITNTGYLITTYTEVLFGNIFENHVQLTLSKDQVQPGNEIDVSVLAQKDSFVGLLAVDQSVLLLKSGNDISREHVAQEWETYEAAQFSSYYWNENNAQDAETVGAVLLSNRFIPAPSPKLFAYSAGFGGEMATGAVPRAMKMCMRSVEADVALAPAEEPTVRANFPETWIWESIKNCNEAQSIRKTIPDTITSWVITGFSLSKTHGLGLTEQPSRVNVFLPFFLSIDLPYSVKLGEIVRIPVIVFNYMDDDQEADVVFFNNDQEFEFVSDGNDEASIFEKHHRHVKSSIASNRGKTFSFMVKPKKVGHITLKITSKCARAGDAIERQLLVEPEGQPQFVNKALLIDLRLAKEVTQRFTVDIPEDAVPDSVKVDVSLIGDVLGSSIENLDSLIRMPFGCGEQNMLNFVPCILVLDYLAACGRLSLEIECKAKKCMEVGYQRELTYKHRDGSFSAFGESDTRGSTWLTAFVAKSFQQAAQHITIDTEVIDRALQWLCDVQSSDGAFPEVGTICHKDMQGGAGSGIALTAYTLIAFLENSKLVKKYASSVEKALAYIESHINELNDVYAHTLAAYALQKADHDLRNEVLSNLESKARIEGDRKWWSKSIAEQADTKDRCCWHRPCSVDVEMSAYALLATLEATPAGLEGLPIMKWLVSQRNDKGGFQSTQDTVVGLQALSKMAASLSASEANISLKVKLHNEQEKLISVDRDNILLLQKYQLSETTRELEMAATGSGCALFQLSYKYNTKDTESPRFTLIPAAKRSAILSSIDLSVSTSFIPQADQSVSNMAVMEVDMPSGCVVESDTIRLLKQHKLIKKVETKRGDTTLVLYFDNLDANVVNLQMSAFQKHEITNAKPANVTIYDYYDNTRCATSFYEVAA